MGKKLMLILGVILVSTTCWADVNLTPHIENPSFESPGGVFPGDSIHGLEGWDYIGGRVNPTGIAGPSTLFPASPPDPNDGSAFYGMLNGAIVSQELSALTVQPNTTYTLKMEVMVPASDVDNRDNAWLELKLDTAESDTNLAVFGSNWTEGFLADHISSLAYDTWYSITLVFDSATDTSVLDETLVINMKGDFLAVDAFTLTATGTQVDLTVNTSAGANGAVLIPAQGVGTYPVGDGWEVPLEVFTKYVDCPDLYTFSQWVGADVTTETQTYVTISGNTTVEAQFTKTSPGCQLIELPLEEIEIPNGSFEVPELELGEFNDEENMWEWLHVRWNGGRIEDVGSAAASDGENVLHIDGWGCTLAYRPGLLSNSAEYVLSADVFVPVDWTGNANSFVLSYTNVGPGGAEIKRTQWDNATLDALTPGTWNTLTCVYDSVIEPPIVEDLILQVSVEGISVLIDNVTLTKQEYVAAGIPVTITAQATAGATELIAPIDFVWAIGQEFNLSVSPTIANCPDFYEFDQWIDSDGNITESTYLSIVADDDVSVTAEFILNNTCGDECRPLPYADMNEDCTVDLADLAVMAANWHDEIYSPILYNGSFETPDTPNEWWEPTLEDQGGKGWVFYAGEGGFHAGVAQDNNFSFADYDAADGTQMGTLWCPQDEISQSIIRFEAGETYTISWSERARQNYTGHLWVLMDGVTLMATHDVSDAAWVEQSVEFTATSARHNLRFFHPTNEAGTWWDTMTHIDNVVISLDGSPIEQPEDLIGDFDGNFRVGIGDLRIFAEYWLDDVRPQ